MDNTLKRLLEVESEAEQIAKRADQERERIIQSAILEARAEETRFESRIPELHAAFQGKADARADQTINELQKRYDERHTQLRNQAEEREGEALETAFNLLIDPNANT